MSAFYDEMQAMATELLTDFDQGGFALCVATPTGPAHSPTITYPETPFAGAVEGVTAQHMKDSLVQAADLAVLMPGTLTPNGADRVKIGGKQHSIVKIIPIPATGTVAAYEVIVRK